MSGPYYFYLHIFTKEDKITLFLLATKSITVNFSDAGPGGGALAPQYLADQLTLFQQGRADYPLLIPLAPPMFFTFRHHCLVPKYNYIVCMLADSGFFSDF